MNIRIRIREVESGSASRWCRSTTLLSINIFHLQEGACSEKNSRMTAMENSSKNASTYLLYLSIVPPSEISPFRAGPALGSPGNETLYLFRQPIRELISLFYWNFLNIWPISQRLGSQYLCRMHAVIALDLVECSNEEGPGPYRNNRKSRVYLPLIMRPDHGSTL